MRLSRFAWSTTVVALLMSGAAAHLVAAQGATSTRAEAPTIAAANVEDVAPFGRDIGRREVRFVLRLALAPACAAGSGGEYGFLIDADKNPRTGVAVPGLEQLGIDARVVMRCEERSRRFVSPIGRVTAVREARSPGLDLVTTVAQLPSVEFYWAPYAAIGNELTLMGGPRRYSTWAIPERSIP